MAIFLQVRSGPVHVLLDALSVHEVLGLEGLIDGAQGHVQWREDVLSAVNMAQLLGFTAPVPEMGVVYSPEDHALPIMLLVEEVLGLKNLDKHHWSAMPRIPTESALFIDGVWLEPEAQRQSFRFKRPMPLTPPGDAHESTRLEEFRQD
jgi:chemotaxis signal transduction protein